MKNKKLILIFGAIVLVAVLSVVCVLIFHKSDSSEEPEIKAPMFPVLPEVNEILKEDDGSAPLTAGILVDSLYALAGNPELKSTIGGCNEKSFVKDRLSGEVYSDSFMWCTYNGVLYFDCTMSVPVENGVTAGVFRSYLRYGSDSYNNYTVERRGRVSGITISAYCGSKSDDDPLENYQIVADTEITYSDAILALYYYTQVYLGVDMTEYADNYNYTALIESTYRMYLKEEVYRNEGDVFSASLSWASLNDIETRDPDEYVYPDAPKLSDPMTVEEYKVILDKYIKYLSEM